MRRADGSVRKLSPATVRAECCVYESELLGDQCSFVTSEVGPLEVITDQSGGSSSNSVTNQLSAVTSSVSFQFGELSGKSNFDFKSNCSTGTVAKDVYFLDRIQDIVVEDILVQEDITGELEPTVDETHLLVVSSPPSCQECCISRNTTSLSISDGGDDCGNYLKPPGHVRWLNGTMDRPFHPCRSNPRGSAQVFRKNSESGINVTGHSGRR